jgi:hypothetical protein
MKDHSAKFELISETERWVNIYMDYYDGDSDPVYDRMERDNATIQATFQLLSDSKQLRVKRFGGFIGLGYETKWYHEIQILNQKGELVDTVIGSFDKEYACYGDNGERIYINSELIPCLFYPDVVKVQLVLPVTFPNYPEFQDEEGTPLNCHYSMFNNNFYSVSIMMDKDCIIDEFVTEEIRQKNIRNFVVERCNIIKEDLMINRWSPKRVEQLLSAGYDVEDM